MAASFRAHFEVVTAHHLYTHPVSKEFLPYKVLGEFLHQPDYLLRRSLVTANATNVTFSVTIRYR